MQGVSINIFVKKKAKSNAPAEIYHYDLYGTRTNKYNYLQEHTIHNVEWTTINPQAPSFFFVPKDFAVQQEYDKGFKVDELLTLGACGLVSSRDELLIKNTREELFSVQSDFQILSEQDFRIKYCVNDSRDWTLANAKKDLQNSIIVPIQYRPFDNRYVLYSPKSKGILSYPRYEIMKHLISTNNISLNICKQQSTFAFQHILASEYITDKCTISSQTKEAGYSFPLYLYPEEGSFDTERRPNFDPTIWEQINTAIGYAASPEDIFDYIYGVLHSPSYRTIYKEFLKVDFPRIPYPASAEDFEHFRSHGNSLRELHLMHVVPESPVTFPHAGNMEVTGLTWMDNEDDGHSGNVYVNSTQCFEGVPTVAWEMYIGGYQPAQKWLKDRKGCTLTYDDIEHYRRIIAILLETDKIMKEIG